MTLKRNLAVSWLSHATTLIVGLFLVRLVKGTLGDAGYGAWIFINSIAGYANLLYLGFGAAVSRSTSRYATLNDWPRLNRILSSIFLVYLCNGAVALLAAGGVALLAPYLSRWDGQDLGEVRLVVGLLGLNAAIGLWGSIFGGVLIGLQRFDIYRGVQIACTLLRVTLFAVALQWSPSILTMAWAYLLVTVAENLAYMAAVRRLVPQMHASPWKADRAAFRESFGYASFNAIGLLSDHLIGLTDTIVIGCMLGTAATVPYYIAQRLCQMARVPLDHVSEMLLPKSAELQSRQQFERLHELVVRAFGLTLLLCGGATIGAAYFGERLIRTWLGEGNDASQPILMLLLFAQLIALPLRVFKMTLMGLGHARVPALFDLGQATANLVLSLMLIQVLGISGVAWGTLLPAAICELGLLLPYACHKLALRPRILMQRGLVPQVLPCLTLWGYCEFISRLSLEETWLSLVVIAGLGGGLLISVWWLTQTWSTRLRLRAGSLSSEVAAP